jgi:hypothetical protein
VKPVLSATPVGGDTGGQTPVQPELTVHAIELTVSSERTYTVKWFVLTKPAEPSNVAVASVVVWVAVAVGLGLGLGLEVGAEEDVGAAVGAGVAVATGVTVPPPVAPPHATIPKADIATTDQRASERKRMRPA